MLVINSNFNNINKECFNFYCAVACILTFLLLEKHCIYTVFGLTSDLDLKMKTQILILWQPGKMTGSYGKMTGNIGKMTGNMLEEIQNSDCTSSSSTTSPRSVIMIPLSSFPANYKDFWKLKEKTDKLKIIQFSLKLPSPTSLQSFKKK